MMKNKFPLYMKVIEGYFLLGALIAIISLPQLFWTGSQMLMFHYFHHSPSIAGRIFSSALLLITTYGLWKRRKYGYYLAFFILISNIILRALALLLILDLILPSRRS